MHLQKMNESTGSQLVIIVAQSRDVSPIETKTSISATLVACRNNRHRGELARSLQTKIPSWLSSDHCAHVNYCMSRIPKRYQVCLHFQLWCFIANDWSTSAQITNQSCQVRASIDHSWDIGHRQILRALYIFDILKVKEAPQQSRHQLAMTVDSERLCDVNDIIVEPRKIPTSPRPSLRQALPMTG